jgi:RNA polymerase sigma-70 factor (ECF subfamily)
MALATQFPRGFDFERQIAAARPRLARIIQSFGVAPDAIDDLIQDTLLTAWRRLDQLRTPERFDAWLDAICRNRCRMYLRRVRIPVARGQGGLAVLSLDRLREGAGGSAAVGDVPDPRIGDPIEELSRQDLTTLLDSAMGELPAPARQALELRYLDELPEREAADQLGMSVSALEARLHRARRQLRRVLGGPLRAQAEHFGLVWHTGEAEPGWQETRIWCNLCGRRRLWGIFEQTPRGETCMRLRCLDCSERFGVDIHNDSGVAGLGGMRSFRPALNRVMRLFVDAGISRLGEGYGACPRCGRRAPVRVVSLEELSLRHAKKHATHEELPVRVWLEMQCPEHGMCLAVSAVEPLVWFHPEARRFMDEHPRWVTTPESVTDYVGSPAIRFRLVDVASTAQLIVLADPVTLRILATFEE